MIIYGNAWTIQVSFDWSHTATAACSCFTIEEAKLIIYQLILQRVWQYIKTLTFIMDDFFMKYFLLNLYGKAEMQLLDVSFTSHGFRPASGWTPPH